MYINVHDLAIANKSALEIHLAHFFLALSQITVYKDIAFEYIGRFGMPEYSQINPKFNI